MENGGVLWNLSLRLTEQCLMKSNKMVGN